MSKPAKAAAKCVNFGGCSKADSRETVEVGLGEDMLCPECGRPLSGGGKAKGGGSGIFKGPVLMIGLGVALLGGLAAFLMWPEPQPDPQPAPAPIPAPAPDPGNPNPEQPQSPDPNAPVPAPAPGPEPQPQQPQPQQPEPQPQPQQPEPVHSQPRSIPEPPQPKRVQPQPSQPAPETPPPAAPTPAPYNGPSSGTIVWEGSITGTELITIQRGSPSSGTIVSGSLPGVPVILQPTDEKRVTIAAAPQPGDQFQRVVFRVKNKGRTRVTLRWAVP